MRKAWEVRVNAIRASGDVFGNFFDAGERMFKELNRTHFNSPADRAHNSELEGRLIATMGQLRKERPRPCSFSVMAMRHGKPWQIQINRLPWKGDQ